MAEFRYESKMNGARTLAIMPVSGLLRRKGRESTFWTWNKDIKSDIHGSPSVWENPEVECTKLLPSSDLKIRGLSPDLSRYKLSNLFGKCLFLSYLTCHVYFLI